MKTRVGLVLLAAGLMTGQLAADDVLLKNGEEFEGVIAERDGAHVRIRLEFGELRIPADSVERIDSSRSALSVYLERRRALLEGGATALEWLELARWARSQDLGHSYREALLEAAGIDPGLEGLEAGMRKLGYVFEAELDRWIPYEEQMRRAGLVPHRGEWVRPEERAPESPPSDGGHRDIEQTLSRTVELLARAQLEREERESRRSTQVVASVPYGYPVAHFGGFFFAAPKRRSDDDTARSPVATPPAADLRTRPPGSLLPAGGANSGVRLRPPGSLIVSGR